MISQSVARYVLAIILVTVAPSYALFSNVFKSSSSAAQQRAVGTVAITGASGLVGTELVQRLKEKGIRVKCISTSRKGDGIITWNPSTGDLDKSELEGLDAIINLAGDNIASGDKSAGLLALIGRWTDAKKDLILSSRIDSTSLLVDTIKVLKKKPKAFLSASAVGYYGFEDSESIFTEKSPLGQGFLADVCQKWESVAMKVNYAHPSAVF
jgi:NAD dependent epimerase/dehydratase family enzyme